MGDAESSESARAAERALCQRYCGRIEMYGLRHLRDRQAARDLVQQVMLAVIEALRAGRVEQPERLDAFVLGTCRNMTWDVRRASGRRQRVAEHASRGMPEGYEPAWPDVDRLRLAECLRRLSGRERAIVLLTFTEDRSAEEIAAELALTPGNVRVLRHRALGRLHACVEQPSEGAE